MTGKDLADSLKEGEKEEGLFLSRLPWTVCSKCFIVTVTEMDFMTELG